MSAEALSNQPLLANHSQPPSAPCSDNPLIRPLLNFNGYFVSKLTEQDCGFCELIKRVALIIVSPFVYLALSLTALIGCSLHCCFANRNVQSLEENRDSPLLEQGVRRVLAGQSSDIEDTTSTQQVSVKDACTVEVDGTAHVPAAGIDAEASQQTEAKGLQAVEGSNPEGKEEAVSGEGSATVVDPSTQQVSIEVDDTAHAPATGTDAEASQQTEAKGLQAVEDSNPEGGEGATTEVDSSTQEVSVEDDDTTHAPATGTDAEASQQTEAKGLQAVEDSNPEGREEAVSDEGTATVVDPSTQEVSVEDDDTIHAPAAGTDAEASQQTEANALDDNDLNLENALTNDQLKRWVLKNIRDTVESKSNYRIMKEIAEKIDLIDPENAEEIFEIIKRNLDQFGTSERISVLCSVALAQERQNRDSAVSTLLQAYEIIHDDDYVNPSVLAHLASTYAQINDERLDPASLLAEAEAKCEHFVAQKIDVAIAKAKIDSENANQTLEEIFALVNPLQSSQYLSERIITTQIAFDPERAYKMVCRLSDRAHLRESLDRKDRILGKIVLAQSLLNLPAALVKARHISNPHQKLRALYEIFKKVIFTGEFTQDKIRLREVYDNIFGGFPELENVRNHKSTPEESMVKALAFIDPDTALLQGRSISGSDKRADVLCTIARVLFREDPTRANALLREALSICNGINIKLKAAKILCGL